MNGNTKPEKARILERGLDMQLRDLGINPMDIPRRADVVVRKIIEDIQKRAVADGGK